jgi:hypothetical protein
MAQRSPASVTQAAIFRVHENLGRDECWRLTYVRHELAIDAVALGSMLQKPFLNMRVEIERISNQFEEYHNVHIHPEARKSAHHGFCLVHVE